MNSAAAVQISAIESWLQTKHCTLWQSWDLTQPDGLHEAAVWLSETLKEVQAHLEATQPQNPTRGQTDAIRARLGWVDL